VQAHSLTTTPPTPVVTPSPTPTISSAALAATQNPEPQQETPPPSNPGPKPSPPAQNTAQPTTTATIQRLLFQDRSPLLWGLIGGLGLSLLINIVLLFWLITVKRRLVSVEPPEEDPITPTEYKILGDLAAVQGKFQLAKQCYLKSDEEEEEPPQKAEEAPEPSQKPHPTPQPEPEEPDDPQSHYEQGKTFFKQDQYTAAIEEFTHYLQHGEPSPDVYSYLAYAYFATGNLAKAEEQYHNLLALKPQDCHAHVGLGVIAQTQGHDEHARAYYEQALELDPDCQEARRNLEQLEEYSS
jgi:tetratricopeptide (TPR) repeat protein